MLCLFGLVSSLLVVVGADASSKGVGAVASIEGVGASMVVGADALSEGVGVDGGTGMLSRAAAILSNACFTSGGMNDRLLSGSIQLVLASFCTSEGAL